MLLNERLDLSLRLWEKNKPIHICLLLRKGLEHQSGLVKRLGCRRLIPTNSAGEIWSKDGFAATDRHLTAVRVIS